MRLILATLVITIVIASMSNVNYMLAGVATFGALSGLSHGFRSIWKRRKEQRKETEESQGRLPFKYVERPDDWKSDIQSLAYASLFIAMMFVANNVNLTFDPTTGWPLLVQQVFRFAVIVLAFTVPVLAFWTATYALARKAWLRTQHP